MLLQTIRSVEKKFRVDIGLAVYLVTLFSLIAQYSRGFSLLLCAYNNSGHEFFSGYDQGLKF